MKGSAILPAFSKRGGHFPDGSSMLDGCFLVLRCNNRTEHLELSFFFFFGYTFVSRSDDTEASERAAHAYLSSE
jgi:hypothetical protein